MKSVRRVNGVARTVDDAAYLDVAAQSPVNVMVTVSDHAGRTPWARSIHDRSARRDGPFVAVCSDVLHAIEDGDGAEDVDAWFARAAGGTLFIDNVARLSAHAQTRLMSLLTEQSRDAAADEARSEGHCVRVIAGCNRSLLADLAVGAFSDSLFYRLNVIHIDGMHRSTPGEHIMKARDLMSKPARTCTPSTDLATVAKLMWDHDCGFIPVVSDSGVAAGVVTDRDICIATSTRRLLAEQIAAADAMATPIHACLADDNLSDVLATMRQFQVRRVPVVDDAGRLQGVISLNDIVLASHERRDPPASEVVATMAAICAHRQVAATEPERRAAAAGR